MSYMNFNLETDDLYSWSIAQNMESGLGAEWHAGRTMAIILLSFVRERLGQEITPEMLEDMRELCARVAYD